MGDFQSFKFENSIPDLCPETQLNFRKFLQAAGIENMLIKDGRRISDTEVLNEIRKEVAVLSMNDDDGRTSSLILACINGDDEAVKLLILSGECDVNEVAPDGETALTCAISSNAVRIVEMLLKHGSDPNFRGKKVECTPLMEAASVGYTDIVKLLLEHGACVAQKSNTGNTALHYAATSGHLECVCLLLQYNSPMEVQNDTGHTPLMEATSNGHVDVARCLIKHGCDINTHSAEFKESALTLASYKGHAEMVRFLLTAGADHEHRTDEMHTALMEAAMEGHVEVARLLLAHGANVNIPQDSFESPLTLAACGGHTELAHLLIGYGADIEEVNDEGYTPLMEAAREGHEETVALLLAVGAEVNARTEETQETALTLAACGGFIEVCEMLLNAGADIEVGGVGCSTPLMEAAQEGHLELVRRLLERGALVNAVTATGDTALHYAAENGHVKVCEKLLDWGAVFGAMTEGGRTPLMKAARTGHLEVVQLFLERGVAIDQPTSQNDANALSLACSGGHAKMVEFLLQHGADPQYQLRDGSTMLIEAARSGNPAVLRLILDYPKCLSQPSSMLPNASVQLVANTLNQHQTQHQFSHDQRSAYQSLVSGVPTIGNVIMPPPPPPLPISVSGIANMDMCLDPSHPHLHPQAHSHSCHSHQQLSFQAPSSLSTSTNSVQPTTHINAALANAYAVGWAAGAAALVHQQQQQQHTINSAITSSVDAPLVMCPPVSAILSHTHTSGPLHDQILLTNNNTFELLPGTSLSTNGSCTTLPTNCSIMAHNAHLNFQTASVTAAVDSVTGITSVQTVLTQATLGASGTGPSSSTTNSIGSISGGSSTSSGSSASSMVAGSSIDLTDDFSAGLLALFQELMPDLKADKDELIKRFEAVMCPFSTLRAARTAISQRNGSNLDSPTAIAMSTNAAVLALSKLIDQQSQCRAHSSYPGNGCEVLEQHLSPRCIHTSSADAVLSKTTQWTGMLSTSCDTQFPEPIPFSTECSPSLSKAPDDQPDHTDSNDHNFSAAANVTPVMSSCHSSCSALSTSECSMSSVHGAHFLCRANKTISTSVESILPALNSYDYGLEKTSDILGPCIDSSYLSNLVDSVGLPTTQAVVHEAGLNNDILTCYRHFHHPGSHFACAFDATATTASVANLSHMGVHNNVHHHHHHHHHSLNVSTCGDNLIGPNNLLHVPQQSSAISIDSLMVNQAGTIAYNPSAVAGYQHVTHPTLLPVSGSRVLPVGPQPILSSGGASIPNHGLSPNDMAAVASNNLSMMGDTISPLNVPSLIDVNACIESSMETALTLACSGGFVDLVRLLLERGADKEHRDKKSHTPLHTAVCANQRSVVSLLLDYGADIEAQVDRTKDTALSIACSHGKLEIVEELLNRGANKEHRNISDYTPLSLAASGGYVEVIQLLLRHGAEINSRTGSKLGISPLMLASMNGHTVAVRLLLEHGSDINAHIETNRNTALTLACFQGRYEVVQLLVERKANIEHRAKTGLTPLMEAASGDYVEVGRILLDYGADVNASPVPSSRDTALTIAADKGNAKFVNLLLEKGGVVEARNKKGATPLWLASNGGHLEVVQSLIQYNADVNSQDNRKVSCLMAAFRKGHINVVRLLVQYVTQFPSDKDCIRHIKTAVTDKELAKRCQQCREIIIAAKEKQEGEAKKNADCLLEQIEQEEEERANREAMQARKRERKRMKRKAKQEKERQVKGTNQTHTDSNVDASSRSNTTAETNENKCTNQDLDEQFSVEHSPTLSRVLQHAHESSLCNQLSDAIIYDVDDKQCSAFRNPSGSPVTVVSMSPESSKPNQQIVNDVHLNSDSSITNVEKPNVQQDSDSIDNSFCSQEAESNAAAVTEAKREKHRNKKQSQRAAKRAAAENNTPFDLDKVSKSPSPEIQDPINSSVSPCYALSPSGDNENWNLLIESQSAHFGQYFNIGKSSNAVSDSNTWTVVVPSNSTRSQRTAVSTHVSSRVGNEMADWKTTNSSNSSYKRRLSIPVSRHDIGKVIGQGGAVVSALRNMSGIQIDIESARSDEVTERMVYLKGPSEAVQRTYETIQGLLDGSIAGNDVLLMYHALKKSSTLPSSMPLSSTALGSLSSRLNGTTSVTVQSTIKSGLSSVKVINPSNRTPRRTGKSVTSPLAANTTRSTSTQPTPLPVVSKPTKTPIVNNSSNITFSSTASTLIPLISSGLKTSTSGSASWSSKVSNTSSSKGNFASVAAAGISTHSSRLVKPVDNQIVKSVRSQSKTTVQNLMTAPATALSLSTTTPVSLLSLNLSPFSSSSHMFPDFIPSLSNVGDFCTDSLDEVSFPPLNPSKCTKITQSRTATTTIIPAVTVSNMRNPSYLSNTHVSSSSVNYPVESVSFEMDKLKINTSSGDLTYMLSISVFDSPVSTVHTASVSNSFPLTTLSATSSSNYGPLTVSPTCGVVQTSQSNTPMGSGSTHTPAYVSTPPTTTTQTKSFARAPGSERSAHQRNANVTATSVSLGLNDSFPPSLLSLDVNGNSNVSVNGGANDTTLFTPTKRAIASDIHNPDFRHDSISNHFRTDRSCEWQTSDPSAAPAQSSSAFVKNTTFSGASNTLTITSTSVGSSVIDSHSAMDSLPVVTNVSQTRDPIGSLHSMPILWSASRPDLNPNSISFQPSFQTLNQVVPNLKASAESADSLIQASLLRNDFSNHSVSDQFQDQYSTQGAQSGVLRQMVTQASLQKSNPVGLSYLQSAHQQTQNSNCSSGLNISSTPSLLPTSSANAPLNASFRFKPPMSGTSAYLESRPTALNGFPSGFCSPSTSSMSLNNQFSSIFPITQQQSFPLQQQLSLGPGTISALNQHTTSGLSTRLGNSSHPMINQTQLSMCSSGPGGSYTPPPFMTGYVQPSIQPVCSSTSVIHPNTNYTSHLINGFSSSSHMGTVCTPTVGAGVPLGIPSNTAQGPVQNQPVPIQPIGAERRRQANTLTSVTSSSIVYPNMSSNNNLAGPVNSAAPVVANPLATMHPQAPSPQQCSVNSNANNLLMAFTMNWMQQQHQQQHSNLVSGVSGTVNSPANWPPPMWPSNNLNNNYPVTCPPMKVPPCNPNDMNIYNNSAILPNTLPAVNGVAGHQHQQSIMAAAMAAMANIYPWNSGSGNGSGNSGILSGIPGISTAGSNRWVCPQVSTAFPGVNPSTPQPYYQEQYPTVKPSGGN